MLVFYVSIFMEDSCKEYIKTNFLSNPAPVNLDCDEDLYVFKYEYVCLTESSMYYVFVFNRVFAAFTCWTLVHVRPE